MRNLLIALTGFLVGTGLVVGLVLAFPQANGVTAKQASAQRVAMPQMSGGRGRKRRLPARRDRQPL